MNFYENFTADQRVQIGTGHTFDIPAFPDTTGSSNEAQVVASALWSHVSDYVPQVNAIKADRRFSDYGRAEHIDPIAETAHLRLVGGWHNLSSFEKSVDMREKALVGVPTVDPANFMVQLEDREIREWWSRQDVPTRAEQMRLMAQGGEAERIALAVLRSPIPQGDVEKTTFRAMWEDSRRAANPIEAERIALGRKSIEWAERNLQYASTVIKSVSGWDKERILKHALTAQGGTFKPYAAKLGFSKQDIAQAELRMTNRR
ncbi:hypothetical protein A6V36_24265 [Paraburkholderia ginsengiterrae]|uniref:Uncharacterized protein n=1 Tax=Paraburkholderia ginsengiterrae TaxID=1462993 RepID=A0A1A9NBM1_9BURK|nr:hypothetical protein [Paraburkholderia ginsengiterrae]OAJ61491.1 hypothetical protein A6V36_24265 [Paraburkholderia ginsengiterrae]OAJ62894.1 hypothetical protein A6V37_22045 [Paraburkholderia ginsengiterrae]